MTPGHPFALAPLLALLALGCKSDSGTKRTPASEGPTGQPVASATPTDASIAAAAAPTPAELPETHPFATMTALVPAADPLASCGAKCAPCVPPRDKGCGSGGPYAATAAGLHARFQCDSLDCTFAIKTAAGWFVDPDPYHTPSLDGLEFMTPHRVRIESLGTGRHVVVVEIDDTKRGTNHGDDGDNETFFLIDRAAFVCGVGRSKVPSCTGLVHLAVDQDDDEGPESERARLSFSDGAVTVTKVVAGTGKRKGTAADKGADKASSVFGRHPLRFP